MTSLSDNHKRRILTSLQYVDKQLEVSLNALTPSTQPLFSGSIQDLTPEQARWVESYTVKIRREMSKLLKRLGIEIPAPSTSAMGTIRTSLTSLDVTLEDMYPEKLQGYGKMNAVAASELTWTLQETRGLVNWLLSFISEKAGSEMSDLGPAGANPALNELCRRLLQIVTDHGLIEFLPAVKAIFCKSRSHRCLVAVLGKAGTGKSTFINRVAGLDLLPGGAGQLLGLPIRVAAGADATLLATFPDHAESIPLARFAEYASEAQNPKNFKRVVTLEVLAPSKRLEAGFAFVELPNVEEMAGRDPKLVQGYLPGADFAIVLLDARAPAGSEEIDLLRAMRAARVPCCAILSNCDLLSPHDVERKRAEASKAFADHLDFVPDVVSASLAMPQPAELEAWFEKTLLPVLRRSFDAMMIAVEDQARSLCKSIITAVERRSGSAPGTTCLMGEAESVLRRLDESVTAFHHRWENEIDELADRDEKILSRAAAILAEGSTGASSALIQAVASHCSAFLPEYRELCDKLSTGLAELKKQTDPGLILSWELPKPQPLPLPLASLVEAVSISSAGALARITRAVATHYYRKELEAKAKAALRQVLDELQPRFRHWFRETMSALREGYRMQTDPVRYWNDAGVFVGRDEKLAADIEFLRAFLTNKPRERQEHLRE